MDKIKVEDLSEYHPPGHSDMTAHRVVGQDGDGANSLWMGRSHFLPGGGAEMSASDTEKIYYVIDGTLRIETPSDEEILLEADDTLHIPPGEKRSLVNPTNEPATMLVIGSLK